MNNRSITILVVSVILILLLVLSSGDRISWYEGLGQEGENPYDLLLFKELVEDASNKASFVEEIDSSLSKFLSPYDYNANYFVIGNHCSIEEEEFYDLVDWVEKGNKAFISLKYLPNKWIGSPDDLAYLDTSKFTHKQSSDQSFRMVFSNNKYRLEYVYKNEIASRSWTRFNMAYFQQKDYRIIEKDEDGQPIFVGFDYGEGTIYYYAEPIVFTNYFLRSEEGFKHASEIIGYMNDGDSYWDKGIRRNPNAPFQAEKDGTPLRFFLSQKSFRAAWYVLLVATLIFLLFRSKRRQRIIPIIKPNKNSSIAFAKAVGQLYFQSKSPSHIVTEMMHNYYFFVRKQYRIIVNQKELKNKIARISKSSGIEASNIEMIHELSHKLLYNPDAKKQEIIQLYRALEYFYHNSK